MTAEKRAVVAAFCLFFFMWAGYFAVRPVRETIGTLLGRHAAHAPRTAIRLVGAVRSAERFIGTRAGLDIAAIVGRCRLVRRILFWRCGICLRIVRIVR